MNTISINLLPEELRPGRTGGGNFGGGVPTMDRETMMPIVIGSVVAAALCAVPTLASMFWLDPWQSSVQADMDQVNKEIEKYNTTLKDLDKQSAQRETLRKQLATLESVAGETASWGDILNELRTLTPGNLWFESFKANSDTSEVAVSGGALDYGSVAYFQRNLAHSEYFVNPVLTRTEMVAGSVPLVKYDMKFTVRIQGSDSSAKK